MLKRVLRHPGTLVLLAALLVVDVLTLPDGSTARNFLIPPEQIKGCNCGPSIYLERLLDGSLELVSEEALRSAGLQQNSARDLYRIDYVHRTSWDSFWRQQSSTVSISLDWYAIGSGSDGWTPASASWSPEDLCRARALIVSGMVQQSLLPPAGPDDGWSGPWWDVRPSDVSLLTTHDISRTHVLWANIALNALSILNGSLLLASAALTCGSLLRRRRSRHNLCAACSYDLSGLSIVGGLPRVCPECGLPAPTAGAPRSGVTLPISRGMRLPWSRNALLRRTVR